MQLTPFRLALTAAALASFAVAQQIIPPAYTGVEANSSTSYPWNRTTTQTRVQYCYDSSYFTAAGVTSPIIISRIKWRANATTATWTGGTWNNAFVSCSTAAVDYLAIGTTFAANHGADLTQVYAGAITAMAGTGNGAGVPGPLWVDVGLTTNFLYDPTTGGDFLVDLQTDGASWVGGNSTSLDCEFVTAAPATTTSRMFNLTDHLALTGTVQQAVAPVIEVTYVPANGIFASFSATPTSGPSPLSVQFTDTTFTSDPGGVVAWAWDVDGDSIIDYMTQNPSHVYAACGSYNVTLTATDVLNGQSTQTVNGFITVDPLSAAFSASTGVGAAPLIVQFTDNSTGTIGSWAWDVDGDSITDYTIQNPLHVYTTPGIFTVSLTVTNLCFSDTETQTNLITVVGATSNTASPEILEYQFNEIRGQSVANTASTTLAPSHGTVNTANWQGDPGRPFFRGSAPGTGMLSNSGAVSNTNLVSTGWPLSISGSTTISWWQRMNSAPGTGLAYTFGGSGGSWRCFTGGVAGTTLWYRGTTLGDVIALYNVQANPGVWEHVALVIDDGAGIATWYFNGVPEPGIVLAASHAATNTGVNIAWNTGTSGTYAQYYDMDDFRMYGRPLNAAEVLGVMASENPTTGTWGQSCDGPGGTPQIGANGAPSVGNNGLAVSLTNAEDARLCALILGFTPGAAGFPVDLSLFLGAGCQLEVNNNAALFHVTVGGAANQGLGVPNNPGLKGLHLYGQWLILGTQGAATRALDINVE